MSRSLSPDPTGYHIDDISFYIFFFNWYVILHDICFQVIGGWTCLHLACRYGYHDIARDLIVKYKCDKEKVKKVYNVIVELCILITIINTLW